MKSGLGLPSVRELVMSCPKISTVMERRMTLVPAVVVTSAVVISMMLELSVSQPVFTEMPGCLMDPLHWKDE